MSYRFPRLPAPLDDERLLRRQFRESTWPTTALSPMRGSRWSTARRTARERQQSKRCASRPSPGHLYSSYWQGRTASSKSLWASGRSPPPKKKSSFFPLPTEGGGGVPAAVGANLVSSDCRQQAGSILISFLINPYHLSLPSPSPLFPCTLFSLPPSQALNPRVDLPVSRPKVMERHPNSCLRC